MCYPMNLKQTHLMVTEARSECSAATHHALPVSTLAALEAQACHAPTDATTGHVVTAEDVEAGQALPGLWQLTTTTLAGGSLES